MSDEWDDPEDFEDDAPTPGAEMVQVQALPIIGHDHAEQLFLEAHDAGKLHHAWLLAGPRGVGKASFALRATRFLLSPERNAPAGGLFGPVATTTLDVPEDDPAGHLIDAGSHPGLLRMTRLPNEKTGKLAATISVDQVRELAAFVSLKSSDDGWRIILIDSVDDMHRSAANAVLKLLEEPPHKVLFFLVCHQPGRLLPTIRSRCRRLAFRPLPDDALAQVLAMNLVPEADIPALVALADGSPGQALTFAGLSMLPLMQAIDAAMDSRLELADRMRIAEDLGRTDAALRYEAFLRLAQRRLGERLRMTAVQGGAPHLSLWQDVQALVGPAVALNDEARAVVFQTLGLLSQLQHGTAAP